jgi:hypothetical protein
MLKNFSLNLSGLTAKLEVDEVEEVELVIVLDFIEDSEVFLATVILLLTKGCVVVVVVGIVEIGLTSISSVVIGLTVKILLVDFIG